MDIHNYKRQLENAIESISASDEFSESNKKICQEFKNDLSPLALVPQKDYLTDIKRFNRMLSKEFEEANRADIKRVLAELNQTELAEATKKDFKIMLKKLYKFIREIDGKGKYPKRSIGLQ